MALGRHGGASQFINVANGKLNVTVDGQRESFDFYDGRLVGIQLIEDEWEGQPVAKVQLTMEDDSGERVKIKFGQETWYSYGFFARIGNVDLSLPFTLGVMPSEQNEKISFCWMRQGGKIEADKENTPRPEKVKRGKKTITDWQGFNEFAERTVSNIAASLGAPVPAGESYPPPPTDADYEPYDDEDSALPF